MKPSPKRGQILLLSLIFSAVMLTTLAGLIEYTLQYTAVQRQRLGSEQALRLAEAGIDKAVYELNQNSNYTGESNTALGNGTFTTSISSIDANTKRITSTGYIPSSARPVSSRQVQVNVSINTSVVSFRFGVQVDQGGVTMSNGAKIVGNLFSNGSISGSGTITGDATVAGGTALTADQQWSVQNGGFNLGDSSSHAAVAESFTPSISAPLNKVSLYLKKTSTPSDITIHIVGDSGGAPSASSLTTGTIAASTVTGLYAFADATLSSNPNLVAGQTYWIIASVGANASKYFTWGEDTGSGYSGASAFASSWNAGSWNPISGDLDFKAYLGGNTTSISGITVNGNASAQSLSNCSVGGNAYYQSISSCSVGGTSYPNSTPQSPGSMPISDAQIADWETTAASGGAITGPYSISNSQSLGPKKISGNLTINNGGSLTLTGPIWVDGNISLSNNATVSVASSLGSAGAVIIADSSTNPSTDGTITLSNNVIINGNGSAGSYPMLLSTNTGAHAISLGNNGGSVILYASKGTISLNNNAGANEITGYGLSIGNNATVTYVNGLQNATFSNGPGGSWTVVPGSYAIVQ